MAFAARQFSTAGREKLIQNLKKAAASRRNLLATRGSDFHLRKNGSNAKIEDGLFGDFDCARFVDQERPYHRVILEMVGAGYTYTEVAKFTGRSNVTVANICKQPWAREFFIKKASKNVKDEIQELLKQEVVPSLKTLVAVRDNPIARSADKITAANSLLDRFLGKPTQHLSVDEKKPTEMTDDELRTAVEKELSGERSEPANGLPPVPSKSPEIIPLRDENDFSEFK